MKLIGKFVDKNGAGYVKLRLEEDEDMWHLYNIIQEGDEIRAPAIRRVVSESTTGSTDSRRVRTMLTLRVTKLHFSPSVSSSTSSNSTSTTASTAINTASSQGATLHVSGRISSENEYVKMGAFHTLDLETNRDVRITKDLWDSVSLDRVTEACDESRGAEVGAVVCGEGTAAFCLLSQHMTIVRQRIDIPISRKRTGSTTLHEKGLQKFYELLYQSFLRHIPYSTLRAIVIASPGFTRDAVYDYIFSEATRTSNKALIQAKNKFLRVHVSSPHVHSLIEVLNSPEIVSQLKETKFAREGIMLDKFFKMLGADEMRAWYGPDHVSLAAERGAVGTLLISDVLFRSGDPVMRKKYVSLVESVRKRGAEVLIFSSMHESGQQLNQLTGIAAILTFPLDIEIVEAEERAAKEEEVKLAEREIDVG